MFNKIFQFCSFFCIFLFLNLTNIKAKEYSILNPLPKDKMRSMTTARPSKSDYSYTIDSGHFQIETSFYSFDKTKTTDSKTTNKSLLNSTALRIGLTQSLEAEIIATPIIWRKQQDHLNQTSDNVKGFSDTTLRLKYNFFGNDSGNFSIAAIPFIKIPTNSNNLSNDHHEGGISLPMELALENGYSLTYNPQTLILKNSETQNYKAVFVNIIAIGKSLTNELSGFVEYYHSQIAENNNYFQQTLDFGLVYSLSENITIDSAINFGLSNHSADIEMLLGGAYRF